MPEHLEQLYQAIAENILSGQGQCVLILGPELSVSQTGVDYKTHFSQLVDTYAPGSKYLSGDNLFYFKDNFGETRVSSRVSEFYKNVGDPVLLEKISRIKFPLIINVCPDEALNNIYKRKSIAYQQGYFAADSKALFNSLPIPTKQIPIIYNLLGTQEIAQSLILTHTKLYESIQLLLAVNSLPDNIEIYLKSIANSFLFLGFKFDSWYYQLVCHKLGLHRKTNICTLLTEATDNISMIMENSVNMEFTTENATQCIDNILARCTEDLRKPSATGKYSTFISYAWKDDTNAERENIVNLIDQCFADRTDNIYTLFRDKRDLSFGGSINSFMDTIGSGKTVIMVISDKYLKSMYCMLEAIRVTEYPDKDKRIFVVMMTDASAIIAADKGKDEIQKIYKKYWFEKYQEISGDPARLGTEECNNYLKIFTFINQFITNIGDKLNLNLGYTDITTDSQTKRFDIADNKKAEFDAFIGCVLTKLKED